MKLNDILGSNERENLTQFSEGLINQLEERIATRRDSKAGIECIVRGKNSDGDYFELTACRIEKAFGRCKKFS